MFLYNSSFFLYHHLPKTTPNHVVKYRLYLATFFTTGDVKIIMKPIVILAQHPVPLPKDFPA